MKIYDWFEYSFKCPKCMWGWGDHKLLKQTKNYDVYRCHNGEKIAIGIPKDRQKTKKSLIRGKDFFLGEVDFIRNK